MLENTEGAIKNRQSRETINIGYTRQRQTKQIVLLLFEAFQMFNGLNQPNHFIKLSYF
jgi:hypothetical protein